jgi:hypothetical protein
MCNECDNDPRDRNYRAEDYHRSQEQYYRQPQGYISRPPQRYDPGISHFMSVITPVTGLTPQHSGVTGSVEFRMRRKNKTVTLQWEPFSGTLAANSVAFLTVAQSISNTPPYPISIPITIQYRGLNRTTAITIDPHARTGHIKFYLNEDGTSGGIVGDTFYVFGGNITWIVD